MIAFRPVPLAVGETFERYEIESLVGRGGMGEVYRATDTRLRRKVALKVLRPDRGGDEAVARLFREARSAAVLSHPNTVAIHDVGEAEGIFYIVMELVTGAPLLTYVGDDRVPVARKLGWLVDVARALAAAHKAGVVHRDVKPSNIMVSDEGVVKVLDFGLAKSLAPMSFRTQHGHSLGTPRYMSPEQVAGEEVDARSDQYAFALTAYELIAGKHPGGALAGAVVPAPLETVVPEVTRSVGQIVAQAMATDPSARFASMDEVVVALEDAIAGRPVRGLAASVAAMSAVPATVADTMPFGATLNEVTTGDDDAERDRPTVSANTTQAALAELATATTDPKPALHHVMGATAPLGPSGTLIDAQAMGRAIAAAPERIDKRTLKSATSAPPPAMHTLVSAGPSPVAKELIAAATAKAAAADPPASASDASPAPAPPSASAKPRSPLVALAIVVLAVAAFGGAYAAAKKVAGAADAPPATDSAAPRGAPSTSASTATSTSTTSSPPSPSSTDPKPPPPLSFSPLTPLVASSSSASSSSSKPSASTAAPIPTPIPTPTPRPPAKRPTAPTTTTAASATATATATAKPTLDMNIR